MEKIFIVPIGGVETTILRNISLAVEKTFQCKAKVGTEMPIPRNSYNSRRKQYHSTVILKGILQNSKTKNFDRILGVMDVDLYVPELNFVFGQADMISGVTVVSLTRLRQEFYGLKPDKKLFNERARKEAIHELGHTFGLGHCRNPKCIMYFSNSLWDTDMKGPAFCSICRKKLMKRG